MRRGRIHIERKLVMDSMLIPGDFAAFIICYCRIGKGFKLELDEFKEFYVNLEPPKDTKDAFSSPLVSVRNILSP